MNPIFPWMGGKRRLADQILPLFPEHECYVELFAGGAALYFLRDEPAHVEVINDLDDEIANLYRVVKHHMHELVAQFRWALTSRTMFEWADEQRPETLTDIQRAARFYYLQHLCFGARPTGRTFGTATTQPAVDLTRIGEQLSAAHLRLSRTYIEHLPWADCLVRYDRPHTFFYADPPYWKMAGYGREFPFSEYERMADLMRRCEGKMMVSINDHPDIRAVFDGFAMKSTKLKYTVGRKKESKESKELIITNWTI